MDFFGVDGGGIGECSQKPAAAGCNLPSVPTPDGKAPGGRTPVHVFCSCRRTFAVARCFPHGQENKAL